MSRRRRRGSSREMWVAFAIVAALAVLSKGKLPAALAHAGTGGAAAAAVPATLDQAAQPAPREAAFWAGVLADLADPDSQADQGSLSAWYLHEEPGWPPPASNNPLNTKLATAGSWTSSIGIREYPTPAAGEAATAETITNYPLIAAGLRSGGGVCGGRFAAEFELWSTGDPASTDGYSAVC